MDSGPDFDRVKNSLRSLIVLVLDNGRKKALSIKVEQDVAISTINAATIPTDVGLRLILLSRARMIGSISNGFRLGIGLTFLDDEVRSGARAEGSAVSPLLAGLIAGSVIILTFRV